MDKKEYQLIEKCKQGNVSAKEWVYNKYAPIMLGVCLRYINDRAEAEDVLHESFIVLFDKIEQLKDNNSFEGWAKRIVINNSLQFLKKQNYDYNIDDVESVVFEQNNESESNSIKDRILNTDIYQEDMLLVINSLPIGFKTVFNLYVFENYKHNEISEKLGISSGTSKSQLLRARKLIQKRLYELVKEKEKSNKKEKVFLSSFIIFMDDDLNYIDKIAHDKLHGFTSVPVNNPGQFINTTSGTTQSSVWGAQSKILTFVSNKIISLSSIILGAAGISFLVYVNNNNEPKNSDINSELPVVNSYDTIAKPDTTIKISILPETKETIKNNKPIQKESKSAKKNIIYDTVHVKKVITVRKRMFIIDTIRKTDTLRSN